MEKPKFEINHIKSSSFSEVQIFNAGYEKTTAQKPPRVLSDFGSFSMHYVFSGCGYYICNSRTFEVKKNEIFFIFPKKEITYYPNKKTPWAYSWIDFYGTKVTDIFSSIGVTYSNPVIRNVPMQIGKLFLENVSSCKKHINASDLIALSHFYQIISALAIQNNIETDLQATNTSLSLVEQALNLIETNYSSPDFDLKILASELGISSAYLSRIMKNDLGITYTEYLTKKRVQKAVALFDTTNLTIKEVSDLVGFSDPYYFSSVFKKIYSQSPRDYIKEVRKSQNANNPPN